MARHERRCLQRMTAVPRIAVVQIGLAAVPDDRLLAVSVRSPLAVR